MRERVTIDSATTARVFANPQQRRLLLHLVASEHTLGELSLITGMTLNLLHYHVQRLRNLRLIKLTREVPRNGRPIKYYRAMARSFFVPAYIGSESRGLLNELQAALDTAKVRQVDEGAVYDVSAGGEPRMRKIASQRKFVALQRARVVRLSDAEANALARQIEKLVRQDHRSVGKSRPYLLYYALAPSG